MAPQPNSRRDWHSLLNEVDDILNRGTGNDQFELSQDQKAQMIEALQSYRANPVDFQQHVRFSSRGYTKNLVMDVKGKRSSHSTGENVIANVIVMCWAPRQLSAFHGHEGSRCFVKVLQGQLLEERQPHPKHEPNGGPDCRKSILLSKNDVVYIDDQLGCHRVTNCAPNEPAITLHVYVPPYRKCRIFHLDGENTQPFDRVLEMANSDIVDVQFFNQESGD